MHLGIYSVCIRKQECGDSPLDKKQSLIFNIQNGRNSLIFACGDTLVVL